MAYPGSTPYLPPSHSNCNACLIKQLRIDSMEEKIRVLEGRCDKLVEANAHANASNATLSRTIERLTLGLAFVPNATTITPPPSTTPPPTEPFPSAPTTLPHKQPTKRRRSNANANAKAKHATTPTPKNTVPKTGSTAKARRPQQCVLCGHFDRSRNMAAHFRTKHVGYMAYDKDTPGYPDVFYINVDEAYKHCPPSHAPQSDTLVGVQGVDAEWLNAKRRQPKLKRRKRSPTPASTPSASDTSIRTPGRSPGLSSSSGAEPDHSPPRRREKAITAT